MGELKYKVGDKVITDTNMKGTIIEIVEEGWYRIEFEPYSSIPQLNSIVPEENISFAEDENKPKFKVGDRVKWHNHTCNIISIDINENTYTYLIKHNDYREDKTFAKWVPENELTFEDDEETPKFKVNDIVFVKNIGWVRITNSYWDSLANEYIYEAIGFNGEGEYDSINQSNIGYLMLSESMIPHTCGNKITLDEYKNNDKEWLFNKLAILDNITALESIQDIFNHLQQSKYPKTFLGCCDVLNIGNLIERGVNGYKAELFDTLQKLLICRDAYWKIAGDEMGLGKPWEPDWTHINRKFYCIYNSKNNIVKNIIYAENKILAFPTEEMRDAFYENFKDLIENCKELL